MGGTWAPVGGHNALEPLAAGCPVLFGPHTEQFPELYAAMAECGAAQCVQAAEVWSQVQHITNSQTQADGPHATMQVAGLAFVARQQGSAARTLAQLATLPCWPVEPMPEVKEYKFSNQVIWINSKKFTEYFSEVSPNLFETKTNTAAMERLAPGSGRDQAFKLTIKNDESWVFRHYARGGKTRKLYPDSFSNQKAFKTRAMQEFLLLRLMQSIGLSVPEPVAANYIKTNNIPGPLGKYKADIIVKFIPETDNTIQILRKRALTHDNWLQIGRQIKKMHDQQIYHSDLNAHNILINKEGQIHIVDFDKCTIKPGSKWKKHNHN
jgi:3-deoxy-D-manno-octulosonic-acid transferase